MAEQTQASPTLDAVELKRCLWETMQSVKAGHATPQSADSIAAQAREILRTVKTQLQIFQQASQTVSKELIDFAKP